MSNTAPKLTPALLDRFRAALAAAGAPLADAIEPGLTDAQIDQLVGELGIAAPPELRTLWTWGSVTQEPASPDSWDMNAQFELWSPRDAVHQTKLHREDPAVSRTTVAFGGSNLEHLLVEGDPTAALSRVTCKPVDDPDGFEAGPSLGALFQLWTTQLEGGDYRYVDGHWDDPDEVLVFIPASDG